MSTAIQTNDKTEKPMEYVPFGAADKIKLSITIIQTTVCIPTKSGKVCTARDALRFMMLCQAQRLNPFAGDCFLCGYDGKNGPVFSLITAHQSFLKRAETCADYEGMESGIILCSEDNVCIEREGDFKLPTEICVGGWARVFRKGRKPTYRRLSIAAMMPNFETPFWSEHKAPGQIVKCAEADALRATFPTLLGGLYSGDELNMNATVSSVAAVDLPMLAASPVPEARTEITDRAGAEAPAEREKLTPQAEIEAKVLGLGFDFETLRKFGSISGVIPDADSLASFDEIPTEVCKRFLRLHDKTLVEKLTEAKGGK